MAVVNTTSDQTKFPPLLAALHLSLFNVLEQSVPTYDDPDQLIPAVQSAVRDRSCRSWVEDYAFATYTYYRVLLSSQTTADGQISESTYPSETFFRLCGPTSEEYRRSLWHLSSCWAQRGEWERVVTKLRPLVEDSIQEASVSWSHERCIIRMVRGLREIGRSQEAVDMLLRVKDAYTKQNKSLTSVEAELAHDHSIQIENAHSKSSSGSPTMNGKEIQIFINTLSGKTITVTVLSTDLVQSLHVAFREREGVPVTWARMIYAGKQLEPERPLLEYGLQNGSTVHVLPRLLGGKLSSANEKYAM